MGHHLPWVHLGTEKDPLPLPGKGSSQELKLDKMNALEIEIESLRGDAKARENFQTFKM